MKTYKEFLNEKQDPKEIQRLEDEDEADAKAYDEGKKENAKYPKSEWLWNDDLIDYIMKS